MNIDELQGVLSLAFGFFSASARPGQTHPAAPPARKRDVMRQNDKAEREHPEAEHGKEPEQAASDEGQTQADPCCSRPRSRNFRFATSISPFAIWKLAIVSFGFGARLVIGILSTAWHGHNLHFKSVVFQGFQDFREDFSKKPLGKSAKRLYYAANPPQGDDPW